MNRFITLLLVFMAAAGVAAQQAKDEIFADVRLSASNHLAYPGPSQHELTPAPKGYRAFYISHYGRHGSRYLIGQYEYSAPLEVLAVYWSSFFR